jgi:hypothetical protein
LVEQWTENPCVPSSNLGSTTFKKTHSNEWVFCYLNYLRITQQ